MGERKDAFWTKKEAKNTFVVDTCARVWYNIEYKEGKARAYEPLRQNREAFPKTGQNAKNAPVFMAF